MKLYAKIQSERGKEIGKGGNEFIDIFLYYENPENMVGSVHMHEDGQIIFLSMGNDEIELTKKKA